jgi:hypothetical protein
MKLTKQQIAGLQNFSLNPFAKVNHTTARYLKDKGLLKMDIVTNIGIKNTYDRKYTLTALGHTELDMITGHWIAK